MNVVHDHEDKLGVIKGKFVRSDAANLGSEMLNHCFEGAMEIEHVRSVLVLRRGTSPVVGRLAAASIALKMSASLHSSTVFGQLSECLVTWSTISSPTAFLRTVDAPSLVQMVAWMV
jgi:hypothetical protein